MEPLWHHTMLTEHRPPTGTDERWWRDPWIVLLAILLIALSVRLVEAETAYRTTEQALVDCFNGRVVSGRYVCTMTPVAR